MSEKTKKARGSLKDGISSTTGGAKDQLGHTPIGPEVFKKTHVRKKENESNSYVWVEERNEFHQYVAENLDSSVEMTPKLSTQIWKEKVLDRHAAKGTWTVFSTAMSDQITKLTKGTNSANQVINLARRPTTSAPDDTDDESDEDDYVDLTP
ncbi:hypothetical protein H5410_017603 [Solanum commersonii]|uniref:Uncharacterized protein n=1 Tax=Solanum commersonii TaxID=4109 RepID=A0A9J6A0G4_SOLCO|nr:hypothetical protein H5410_017603 [Solanum commersonii]